MLDWSNSRRGKDTTVVSVKRKPDPAHPDHPIAGRDFPLVHQPAAGDDISAAVQSRRGADVGGYGQDAGPYRVLIGRGGVDKPTTAAVMALMPVAMVGAVSG